MALPVPSTPTYTTKLPISEKEVKYRGFLVGEEKLAILALTDADEDNRNLAFMQAAVDIAQRCVLTPDIEIKDLETADFEHLFIKLRMVSKDNKVELNAPCSSCNNPTKIIFDLHDVRLTEKVDNKIILSDDIGIKLNGPTVQNILDSMTDDKQVSKRKMLFDSVNCIWQGDVVYNDFTDEEFDTWLEALDKPMMNKINDFFNKLPSIVADIKFTCNHGLEDGEVCGHENDQVIKGIPRFFA